MFRGKVYDCTPFFEYHPGGAKFMLAVSAISIAVPHIRRGHLTLSHIIAILQPISYSRVLSPLLVANMR